MPKSLEITHSCPLHRPNENAPDSIDFVHGEIDLRRSASVFSDPKPLAETRAVCPSLPLGGRWNDFGWPVAKCVCIESN